MSAQRYCLNIVTVHDSLEINETERNGHAVTLIKTVILRDRFYSIDVAIAAINTLTANHSAAAAAHLKVY